MGNSDNAYVYNIPNLDESKVKNEYKIAFIGQSGSGTKTSLINRLSGEKFDESQRSSNGVSYSNIKIKLGKKKIICLNLWDLPGNERYESLAKHYLGTSDCVVIGYDINDRKSYEKAINHWYPLIKNENKKCDLIYLIGNKMDLYKKDESIIEEAMDFAKSEKLGFYAISCKTDQGIGEFFDDLVNNIVYK